MNPRTTILGAALALAAAAPAAEAQMPGLSYARRGGNRALSLCVSTPDLALRRPTLQRRVWIPGHRERALRRIWVAGDLERRWIPPVYDTMHGAYGLPVQVLASPGRWALVREPGHFQSRWVEVWVDGHWKIVR